MTAECDAPGKSCGTVYGWRKGGRCTRCRVAHNAEVAKYRGLRDSQRAEVLKLLRAGHTREEAAAAIGKTPQTLSSAAVRDGELWAALAGLPPQMQRAARKGDFLAALTRTGGSRTDARRLLGITADTDGRWRNDPSYAAAEEAVIAWVKAADARRPLVSDEELDRAADLLLQEATFGEAASAIGLTGSGLKYAARRHRRLAAVIAKREQQVRHGNRKLTPLVEKRLREMWADKSLTVKEIARQLGISRATVTNWCRVLELPSRMARTGQPGGPTRQVEER